MTKRHCPLGPEGTWKSGQRVPVTGRYVDQHGTASDHEQYDTFPPCVNRRGEVAFRRLVKVTQHAL